MKIILRILSMCILLQSYTLQAQIDLQNTGTLYISTGSDILYINGALTNASTAALTNNGQLYVRLNLTNSQSGMAIGTGTLNLTGSSSQTIGGTQPFKTFNLVTDNTAGILLNANLDVSGAHTFTNGMITTSATPNYLIYQAGSSYSGDADSRHVNGWVKKFGTTNFIFPVGNATYERTIAIQSLSASSEFNAIYRTPTTNINNLMPPIVMVQPNEYWEVNRISGGTVQMNVNWSNTKVAIPQWALSNMRAIHYNAGLWTDRGGSASGNTTTTGNITSNTVSAFGFFTIGSIDFTLPLRFINITAQRQQNATEVQWKTADEMNVDHFEVERSNNGTVFTSIGSVSSNSNGGGQYEFTDGLPLQSRAYYRIRAVDKDGQVNYSGIVTVFENTNRSESLYVLNNPAHQSVYLYASSLYKGTYKYELYNTAGQLAQKGQITMDGNNIASIPLTAKVFPGSYILSIHNESHRLTEKILVR